MAALNSLFPLIVLAMRYRAVLSIFMEKLNETYIFISCCENISDGDLAWAGSTILRSRQEINHDVSIREPWIWRCIVVGAA
jgi:hypothetical protein